MTSCGATNRGLALLLLVAAGCAPAVRNDSAPNQGLAEDVAAIKAIDNHAHPLRVLASGETSDDEYDALTYEGMEPFPIPVRLNPGNPEYVGAWQTLFGFPHNDATDEHVRELIATKQRVMREQGDNYSAWVLDRLGIEAMLANRVAMGRGLTTPRFRWVPFVDALLFPLDNEPAKRSSPDYRAFFTGEEKLLKRYVRDSGQDALPASLPDYLAKVVTPTLERLKQEGAVAIKFEAAYLRSLDFSDVREEDAQRVYGRYVRGGEPTAHDYKMVQDFLFRQIAREAGRLGLVVHIHATIGAGGYYRLSGSNPLLLDPVFNDPTLRQTQFVIVHGGWPYSRETAFLISKPNVHADYSALTFLLYPRALGAVLREWLEMSPDKILFGTDATPLAPQANWEETAWMSVTSSRRALTLALTAMIEDGEISREQAIQLARLVLRENALKLYGLPQSDAAQTRR